MTWNPNLYIKLLIERPTSSVGDKYLIALRSTADYYGWTQEFPTWTPRTWTAPDGTVVSRDPGRRGEMFCEAGFSLRVSRSPVTSGWPAGFVNSFKVSKNCTWSDVAEVAHFTKGEWYWMTCPYGERVSRDRWETRFQTRERNRARGLVSV